MIGIIGVVEHRNLHDAFLHLATVFAFLAMVVGHKLFAFERRDLSNTREILRSLTIELVLIAIYAIAAIGLHRVGLLEAPNLTVFLLVCLGSFVIYLQNNMVTTMGDFPTSSMVMTGNYISLLTHSINVLAKSKERETARDAVRHFACVHLFFWGGVALTAWAIPHIDFVALFLPCLALMLLIRRLKASTNYMEVTDIAK
jgi:uncharacterized membrane protein YoaK (UPF0700 family)